MPYSSSEILPKVLPSFCNQDVGKLGGGERGDKIKKEGGKSRCKRFPLHDRNTLRAQSEQHRSETGKNTCDGCLFKKSSGAYFRLVPQRLHVKQKTPPLQTRQAWCPTPYPNLTEEMFRTEQAQRRTCRTQRPFTANGNQTWFRCHDGEKMPNNLSHVPEGLAIRTEDRMPLYCLNKEAGMHLKSNSHANVLYYSLA